MAQGLFDPQTRRNEQNEAWSAAAASWIRHDVEANVLGAFINELEAQRGKQVETRIANRFIALRPGSDRRRRMTAGP